MTDRIVVVGAGPAGLRAAEVLAQAKVQPILIDENPAPGGRIYQQPPGGFQRGYRELYGFEARRAWRLHEALEDMREQIDYRPNTLAWGIQDKLLDVVTDGVQDRIPFDAIILAPGAVDLVLPIAGWTKAGVHTLGAAEIALKHQGCAIGSRTVFVGTGPLLYIVAYQYAQAGADVAAVLDTSPASLWWPQLLGLLSGAMSFAKLLYYIGWLKMRRIPVLNAISPVAVEGEDTIEALVCRSANGQEFRVAADAVAMGFGLLSECQLADLAGCEFTFDPSLRQWLPVTDEDGQSSVEGVYFAGDGRRIVGAEVAEAGGALAAFAALIDLGYPVTLGTHRFWRSRAGNQFYYRRALEAAYPAPVDLARRVDDRDVICRCEGITAGEIRRHVVTSNIRDINSLKAHSGIGSGSCQGRYCAFACAELLAETVDMEAETLGRLNAASPIKPIDLTDDRDEPDA